VGVGMPEGVAIGVAVGVGVGPAWAIADQIVTISAAMTRVPMVGRRVVVFDTVPLPMRGA
jgi:hypothetical protein